MSVKMKTILFFLVCVNFVRSYNVKYGSTISTGSSDGLFGHSVALSQSDDAFIGAPHDSTHGNVFKCSLQSSQCSPMTIKDMTNNETKNFFGSTVTIQDDNVVTCAYGEILKEERVFEKKESGVCYKANSSSNAEFQKDFGWQPESQESKVKTFEGKAWSSSWQRLGISLMGSHHIQTKSGSVIFNTPFARNEDYQARDGDQGGDRITGTIVQAKKDGKFTVAEGNWLKNFTYVKNDTHTFDETGSAIVQGKFFDSNGEHFAIGAPNADRYRGKVYVCQNCFNDRNRGTSKVVQPTESQMGERFGSSMVPFKIDEYSSDDDLIVGAPLYCDMNMRSAESIGRIVIFKNKNGRFNEVKVLVSPDRTRSGRFGFVIANLGDIDNDGYEDFAVGAPGIDRVFVYYGNKNYEEVQEIQGSNLNLGSGFGYALSQQKRTDKSFAVGAPFENSVVVFNARKVVSFTPDHLLKPVEIEPRIPSFNMSLTIELKGFPNDQESINVQINFKIKKSSRFIIDPQAPFKMNGTVKKVQVEVRPSGDKTNFVSTKFNNPLKIRGDLTFDLGCYDQDCPMIRSSSELQNVEISDDNKMIYSFKKEIDLAYECQPDPDDCQCELTSTQTESQKNLEIVIGETDSLNFDLGISNIGKDLAFGVDAGFNLISGAADLFSKLFKTFPITSRDVYKCKTVKGSAESGVIETKCPLSVINLQGTDGDNISPKFKLSIPKDFMNNLWDLLKNMIPSGFPSIPSLPSLIIKPSLDQDTSKCKDIPHIMDAIVVKFVFKTTFEIQPISQPTMGYNDDQPLEFVQSFKIKNQGPSFTNKPTNVKFFIPKTQDVIKLGNFTHDESTINCTDQEFQGGFKPEERAPHHQLVCNDASGCVVKECQIQAGMKKDEEKEFKIRLIFERSKATNATTFVVTTGARIDNDDQNLQAEASIELYSKKDENKGKPKAKVWPMVLGACLGLLIIIMMGTILWKTGLLAKMRPYQKKEDQIDTRQMKSLSTVDLPAD